MRKISKWMAMFLVGMMVLMLFPSAAFASDGDVSSVDEPKTIVVISEAKPIDEEATIVEEKTVAEEPQVIEEGTVTEESAVVEEPIVSEEATVVEESVAVEEPLVIESATVVEESAVAEKSTIIEEVLSGVANESDASLKTTGIFDLPQILIFKDESFINVMYDKTGDGYSYDELTNALTLNNFTANCILANMMGDNFSIVIIGDNYISSDVGIAIYVMGDLNLNGTGKLTTESEANEHSMGVGIRVIGDLVVDGGSYDITATSDIENTSTVGILVGASNSGATEPDPNNPQKCVINDGDFKVKVFDNIESDFEYGGAYGIYSFGDQIINDGNFDILTQSKVLTSMGMGAMGNMVFNGGDVKVRSTIDTDSDMAACLFSEKLMTVNDGTFDLLAVGGEKTKSIYGMEGTLINSEYGDVDDNLQGLKLAKIPKNTDSSETATTLKITSTNPKTGIISETSDAFIAGLTLIVLMGLIVFIGKRGIKA